MLKSTIQFFITHRLVAWLLLLTFVGWGLVTSPFDFGVDALPRDPVAVDAIPDIGENQQIVFTKWPGRSPQDVEDQVTYPLTSALLGLPGVKSIRSNSMFGFSSIYVIFDDDVDFYWSRSRILEKLNSLPAGLLPPDVQPALGPDATALGQIFWYTLEGRDPNGRPTGGWDLHELRSIQDFYVRYGLSAAEGVAEVASIGGFVKTYEVDVDPDKMRVYGVSLPQVVDALRRSNLDVGARTMEINKAEYFVRGLGYVHSLDDIENAVVKTTNHVPILIKDVARVNVGPADRRGVLDKSGAEAVGGVVVARYGANPMAVIQHVKAKIAEIAPGLPKKTLADGTVSQVTIVPFYDRSKLIRETLGTLQEALTLEVLITIIVIILMLFHLRSSFLVAGTLPVAVLMCFIAMRYFGVDANIVALSGIAIAIGTMVDMGIVLTESIVHRLRVAPDQPVARSVYEATTEVASAVVTAVATTIISFLPVFTMQAAEGKLFRPLAFTKTFALVAAIVLAITILPALAVWVFKRRRGQSHAWGIAGQLVLMLAGAYLLRGRYAFVGLFALAVGITSLLRMWVERYRDGRYAGYYTVLQNIVFAALVAWLLARTWMPLGVAHSEGANFLFVALVAGGLIGFFHLIIRFYEPILRFLLEVKWLFLLFVGGLVVWGVQIARHTGREFMPALDEGAFLLMPTAMPHAGMDANVQYLKMLDMAVTAIPEVEEVVGKAGRVESALDPAPASMFENIITYKSEYMTDAAGHRLRFKTDAEGHFLLAGGGSLPAEVLRQRLLKPDDLVPDPEGSYFRQWRDHIRSPDDIWKEIVRVTKIPGLTSAPKLQPIETRLVMLQTGMRAPMGIKVRGPDLKTIEATGIRLEKLLKQVEGVKAEAVFADRIVGKPYLLFEPDRVAIARYGLRVQDVLEQIRAAVGGVDVTTTVEGRERYAVQVRYPRELRDSPAKLKQILVATPDGIQIPLGEVAHIRYAQGPQSIKSEDNFLVGYVLFDKQAGYSEVEVVEKVKAFLDEKIKSGEWSLPAGVSYAFAGNYQQQVRASKRLAIVIPIALLLIFLILYFQFNSVPVSLMVFSGVFVAFSGGFLMIWLYGQPWFMDFTLFGVNMRDLFQIHPINLSVAVWVGFLALFGIATDDGVLVATFLQSSFAKHKPRTREAIRDAVVTGGKRRVKPAMMTTATTVLALLPVLTSTGRGADIMLPMAIPSFGGMLLQLITMFTVPVMYAAWEELVQLKMKNEK